MEPWYICLKFANLDDKSKSKIELTKDSKVEEEIISKNQNYFWKNLKFSPKIEEDITKWNNYKRIKNLSDLRLEKKKSKTRHLNLDITIKVENITPDLKTIFKNLVWINTYTFYGVQGQETNSIDFQSLDRELLNNGLDCVTINFQYNI